MEKEKIKIQGVCEGLKLALELIKKNEMKIAEKKIKHNLEVFEKMVNDIYGGK